MKNCILWFCGSRNFAVADPSSEEVRLDKTMTRWWQLTYFLFWPLFGEIIYFDEYFSNGLKPPTRWEIIARELVVEAREKILDRQNSPGDGKGEERSPGCCWDMAFFGSGSLKSPWTRWSEKIYNLQPDSEGPYWKWYKTNCPGCRRPLEITMSSLKEEPWTRHPRGSRHAFVTALWGANASYKLGALVLGSRLRELSPHIERVLVHTDNVPSNYLEAFEKDGLWQLRKVDYIDGVSDYIAKVLLLDLDIILLKPLDELFQLPCPATMMRGQGEENHAAEVDGHRFFGTEDYQDYPWAQSGGINAGLILLQPDYNVFQQMLRWPAKTILAMLLEMDLNRITYLSRALHGIPMTLYCTAVTCSQMSIKYVQRSRRPKSNFLNSQGYSTLFRVPTRHGRRSR